MKKGQLFILNAIGPQRIDRKEVEAMRANAKQCHDEDENLIAYDDVTGAALDPKRVQQARADEMEYFRKMGVYCKVPKSKCFQLTERGL